MIDSGGRLGDRQIFPSIEHPEQDTILQKRLDAVDELNGLISDLSEKNLDEFDWVISERNPFRRAPIQL